MSTKELISGVLKGLLWGHSPSLFRHISSLWGEDGPNNDLSTVHDWLFLKGTKRTSEHLEKSIIIFKNPCEFFSIHISLLIYYGPKTPTELSSNQTKGKEKKKKKHSKGRLKTKEHIKVRSALLQLSRNDQIRYPVPSACSWKTKTITRGSFTTLHFLTPHPAFRNLDSSSVVISFQRGKLTVNGLGLE